MLFLYIGKNQNIIFSKKNTGKNANFGPDKLWISLRMAYRINHKKNVLMANLLDLFEKSYWGIWETKVEIYSSVLIRTITFYRCFEPPPRGSSDFVSFVYNRRRLVQLSSYYYSQKYKSKFSVIKGETVRVTKTNFGCFLLPKTLRSSSSVILKIF